MSGGGDSVALLHILAHCFEVGSVELSAVTVDHGLRPEAADEARLVAGLADELGIPHTVLRWTGWDGSGNLQARAREARYRLISDWAKSTEVAVFALGHTADDQAETVLMGLARRSGVNGLSAMPLRRVMHGISMVRPLLNTSRDDLREYLTTRGIAWAEDPSNDDQNFDRVKMREALRVLESYGLTAQAFATVARNMAQARESLDWFTFLTARDIATVDGGDVALDLRQFRTLPEEIARRLLVHAINWVGGQYKGPRHAAVTQALKSVRAGLSITLNGCHVQRFSRQIWISREYNAVSALRAATGDTWDRRWRCDGRSERPLEIRALGREGLNLCPEWRLTGRPLASLIASPAVWDGPELVAAPLAGRPDGWDAWLVGGEEEFFASVLSH